MTICIGAMSINKGGNAFHFEAMSISKGVMLIHIGGMSIHKGGKAINIELMSISKRGM